GADQQRPLVAVAIVPIAVVREMKTGLAVVGEVILLDGEEESSRHVRRRVLDGRLSCRPVSNTVHARVGGAGDAIAPHLDLRRRAAGRQGPARHDGAEVKGRAAVKWPLPGGLVADQVAVDRAARAAREQAVIASTERAVLDGE